MLFLRGGGRSQCPFSTRLRVLKLSRHDSFLLLGLQVWEDSHTSIFGHDEGEEDSPPPSAWQDVENGDVLLRLQLS